MQKPMPLKESKSAGQSFLDRPENSHASMPIGFRNESKVVFPGLLSH